MIPSTCLFNYRVDLLANRTYDASLTANVLANIRTMQCDRSIFWTDAECAAAFSPARRALFLAEPDGRLRSDFCRLEMLRRYGGTYLDNDLQLLERPSVENGTTLASIHASPSDVPGIFQAYLASTPEHPIVVDALRRHVAWYAAVAARDVAEIERVTKSRPKPNVGTVLLLDAYRHATDATAQMFHERADDSPDRCYCQQNDLCNYYVYDGARPIMRSRFRAGDTACLSKPCRARCGFMPFVGMNWRKQMRALRRQRRAAAQWHPVPLALQEAW